MAEAIDRKYLAGLKFRSSKPVKGEEGTRHQPTERPLQPRDVLDWKDNGPRVTIVTADGQKYTVDKKTAEKEEKKAVEEKKA